MWINRHWKLMFCLTLVLLVTGSIQLIEGGACVDNKCLLIVNDPYRFNDAYEVIVIDILEFNHTFLRPLDGGTCIDGSCLLVMRDPFYYGDPKGQPCNVNVNIYNPVEGDVFYSNNVLVNFSVKNAAACFYRTSGDWNPISCTYDGTRTMLFGEVTLTVMGVDGACIGEDSVDFYVFKSDRGAGVTEFLLVMMPLFGMLLMFMLGGRNRKKRKDV